MFSVCPQGEGVPQGTYPPGQVRTGGGGTLRYLPPTKVPTPHPGQDGGYPKVPTPHQVPTPRDMDTLQSVYLLRSRRRTFLLQKNKS